MAKKSTNQGTTQSGVIRVPAAVVDELAKITPEQLAAMPSAKRARLSAAAAALRLCHLDAPAGGSDTPLGEMVAADAPDPLEALHWEMEAQRMAANVPEAWAVLSNPRTGKKSRQRATAQLRAVA